MITRRTACIIGNGGLGDTITYIGMVNYLATKYEYVIVACMQHNKEQIRYFFSNPRIIIYSVNDDGKTGMAAYDIMMRKNPIYDIYAFGHYGSDAIDYDRYYKIMPNGEKKKIIHDYPISYYEDVDIPISYMVQYFHVDYPMEITRIYEELFKKYPRYRVVHQIGSTASFDVVKHNNIKIDEMLTIDINKNLYPKNHRFYGIADKFVNLKSVIFYAKLIENASALYLIDSCIHAVALVVDVSHAFPRICYQREPRMKYGFDKFDYYLLTENGPFKVQLPLDIF